MDQTETVAGVGVVGAQGRAAAPSREIGAPWTAVTGAGVFIVQAYSHEMEDELVSLSFFFPVLLLVARLVRQDREKSLRLPGYPVGWSRWYARTSRDL